jgi:hypothetical protein
MNKYAKNGSSFSLLFAPVKHKKQEVNSCDGIYLLSCFYIAFTPMVWALIVFYLITFTTFCEPSANFVTTMLRPLTAVLLATPAGV